MTGWNGGFTQFGQALWRVIYIATVGYPELPPPAYPSIFQPCEDPKLLSLASNQILEFPDDGFCYRGCPRSSKERNPS